MDIANLPRYEMGRCVSCGDCNREPAYVDEQGEWVKLEDVKEFLPSATTNSRRDEIIRLLDCMSADERTEIFAEYCTYCGDKDPRCQCWNDE